MAGFDSLKVRTLIAFIYVPILLLFFFFGKIYMHIFFTAIGLICLYEVLKNLKLFKFIIFFSFYFVILQFIENQTLFLELLILFVLLAPLIIYYFMDLSPRVLARIGIFLMLYILISIGCYYTYLFRNSYGFKPALFVLLSIWIYDNFAYFIGVKFGKNHIFSVISPKKSLEGVIGGLLCNFVLGGVVGIIFFHNILNFAIFSVLIGILAQIGDLYESLFKRYLGIKDFSNILPGHGGILDRFDSILFSFPIIYFFTRL